MFEQILKKLETERRLTVGRDELNRLLEEGKIIKEVDTLFSGYIRILEISNNYIIQEHTNKSEIILRKALTLSEAEQFLQNRLRIYDRMWDGCGCKINYYE